MPPHGGREISRHHHHPADEAADPRRENAADANESARGFTHILQDSLEIGSDNEHMVFFNLKAGFLTHEGLYVHVKQIAGGEFESTPLEIGPLKSAGCK